MWLLWEYMYFIISSPLNRNKNISWPGVFCTEYDPLYTRSIVILLGTILTTDTNVFPSLYFLWLCVLEGWIIILVAHNQNTTSRQRKPKPNSVTQKQAECGAISRSQLKARLAGVVWRHVLLMLFKYFWTNIFHKRSLYTFYMDIGLAGFHLHRHSVVSDVCCRQLTLCRYAGAKF